MEKHTDVPFSSILSILNDVGLGLQYLHNRSPPIVHRDLTPNNILLCYHLRAKITDLGVAKVMQTTDSKTLTKAPGTQCFMPPESLANNPDYSLPLDIFSFGGVILYVTTQQWPSPAPWIVFDDTGKKIVLTELERRQQYLDKMTGIYADLKPLAVSCLDDNPKNRPSVSQALLDIKKAKSVFYQSFFSAIWGTKVSGEQQLIPQLRNPCDQILQKHKQQKQDQQQSELQERQQQQQQLLQQQEVQLQKREEEHQQCVQQKHDEYQQLKEQQLPQVRDRLGAFSQVSIDYSGIVTMINSMIIF